MISILFYSIIIFVVFIDQLSKYWIRSILPVGETLEVWEGILHFTHIQNSGAAFGLFAGYGRFFVPVALIVFIVSIYLYKKGHLKGKVLEIGVALFVGGGIGNAIDRTLFNQVTDFIDIKINNGIPNLADYALFLGTFLICIEILIIDPIRRGKNAKRVEESHSDIE